MTEAPSVAAVVLAEALEGEVPLEPVVEDPSLVLGGGDVDGVGEGDLVGEPLADGEPRPGVGLGGDEQRFDGHVLDLEDPLQGPCNGRGDGAREELDGLGGQGVDGVAPDLPEAPAGEKDEGQVLLGTRRSGGQRVAEVRSGAAELDADVEKFEVVGDLRVGHDLEVGVRNPLAEEVYPGRFEDEATLAEDDLPDRGVLHPAGEKGQAGVPGDAQVGLDLHVGQVVLEDDGLDGVDGDVETDAADEGGKLAFRLDPAVGAEAEDLASRGDVLPEQAAEDLHIPGEGP